MTNLFLDEFTRFSRNMKTGFDVAPEQQYREYEGGSVYYTGDKSFKNEYLKVIGKKYDGESASEAGTEYTGEIKTQDGTEIVGKESIRRRTVISSFPKIPTRKNSTRLGNLSAGLAGQRGRRFSQRRIALLPFAKTWR